MVASLARGRPACSASRPGVMPLATGLYLLTTTAWTVCERAILGRRMAPAASP